MIPTTRRLRVALVLALAAITLTGFTPAALADPPVRRLSGTLPSGASWIAEAPQDWNGVLVLFSHGYNPPDTPNPPENAPGPESAAALLDRGYALAGSSYAEPGWTLDTAVEDQLATLAAVSDELGTPRRTIALGRSMGGLVTAQLAERADERIDGALAMCGILAGGLGLLDSQLDGAHALTQLLGVEQLPLVDFTGRAQVRQVAGKLREALSAAQSTPEGRARIALAAALFHAPTWYGDEPRPTRHDWAARQAAQYRWLYDTLPFVLAARYDIEQRAGGNPSTSTGVDYRALLKQSATRRLVAELHRDAGLDPRAELSELTATARVTADPSARDWVQRTSTVTGELAMPMLTVHTTADGVVPGQFEDAYADQVRTAGNKPLLRGAYVARTGHCTFTPAETVAAVDAINTRVATGHWAAVATPESLDAAAEAAQAGDSDYVRYRPGEFLGDEQR
ncbi:hypothetical protein [Haloactinomyces albus]|uniref:Pimeloyl-ACP methyl ester carboxylesterase n=1 Tax=Haloactinomyces albus TaxID=1352928 RepID=A0AAE3ZHZ1_9ACTN|nr:hypothetical protein [Haloactinomyces albus]MDR7304010.1 pimeloyl-ACP methyl ester carboxylesterase [Haloactinomyces albus]